MDSFSLRRLLTAAFALFAVFLTWFGVSGDEKKQEEVTTAAENLPATREEAISRARWMHELINGSLQVMHRDYFGDGDKDNGGRKVLPSQSLEDVFREMRRTWGVQIVWLGVNAVKDIDHEPADDFELDAAFALEDGEPEYSAVEGNRFRYVGAVPLQNECLKCHVPNRKTLEDRVAGLGIYMPMQAK